MSARFTPLIVRIALMGLLLAGAPGAAFAQCRLDVVRAPPSVLISYDPFEPAPPPERLRLRLRNPSAEACSAEIALVDDGGAALSRVALADAGLVLEVAPGEGLAAGPEPGVFRVQAAADAEVEAVLELVVLDPRVVEAGTYLHDLVVRLRDGVGLSAGRDVRVPLSLHALPRAQLNLAGALGSFGQGPSVSRVDFGVAEAGKTERVFVQSRTNAPARIRITSANKGVLRSEDDPEEGAGVRYSAVLDNRPLDLSQPAAVDVDPPRTFQGESLELLLTLGPVPPLRAGAYSDALTFEISTL